MLYSNPILRGFFPDPSVVRVGEDYYMVNSSFQYFPSIPVSHSKDLVNWEIIGHAVTESEYLDLSEIKDSHGIWAPDIFYYNGEFYIIATLRLNDGSGPGGAIRRQMLVKSKSPEGPYSEPIWLDVDAIDPSLFVDDDGRKYMVIAKAATVYELSDDFSKVISEKRIAWGGTGERCSEGPHIMKKDGYYYAIVAEGGTGYGHGINVARSRTLFGEYENCPYNPVIRQTDPEKLIQRSGHGKLVDDINGDWWAFYLCGRRNGGNYTTLGRETAMDPVRWTDDGWFLINEGKGPSETQTAPSFAEGIADKFHFFDDFDLNCLNREWEFVRNPNYDDFELDFKNSRFRIWTGDKNLDEIGSKNTLLHRESEFNFTAETKLSFEPSENCRAGLTCYYSTATYIRFNLTKIDGDYLAELVINKNEGEEIVARRKIDHTENAWLRVKVSGQSREFFYSADGEEYISIGTVEPCVFLCDEGVPNDRKRHTGTLTGIFANSGGTKMRIPADFDWFDMKFEV